MDKYSVRIRSKQTGKGINKNTLHASRSGRQAVARRLVGPVACVFRTQKWAEGVTRTGTGLIRKAMRSALPWRKRQQMSSRETEGEGETEKLVPIDQTTQHYFPTPRNLDSYAWTFNLFCKAPTTLEKYSKMYLKVGQREIFRYFVSSKALFLPLCLFRLQRNQWDMDFGLFKFISRPTEGG